MLPARSMNARDYPERPIPVADCMKTALDYHDIEIDLDGPANREKLVPVKSLEIVDRSIYFRPVAPFYQSFAHALADVLVREGIGERLLKANKMLAELGG